MQLALNVTFVGMFVVFLSLIILSIIIDISGRAFSRKNSVNGAANPGNSKAAQGNPGSLKDSVNELADSASDNGELISVVTAAIAAYLKPGLENKIRVRSIRRIPQSTPVWNVAGRMEHIAGKQ